MGYPTVQELFGLTGDVAIVTGGVRGLGAQAAEALAEAGAQVVVTSRDESSAVRAARELKEAKGVETLGLSLEVTSEESWNALIKGTMEAFGRIDILVNNAGGRDVRSVPVQSDLPLDEMFLSSRPLEEWRRTVDVNLTGVFLGCRAVALVMKQNRKGKIINMASTDGMLGRDLEVYRDTGLSPTVPDYLASKAGVINLTRAIAVVLAPYNVYVNCISPAGFERGQPKAFVNKYSQIVPLGRMGRDGIDLKGPVLLLASHASDFMVGHNLVVDGGFTAW